MQTSLIRMFKVLLPLVISLFGRCALNQQYIQVDNIFISGTTDVSRNGRPYTSYKKIPYAEPPIGPLRFKNPQPYRSNNNNYSSGGGGGGYQIIDGTKESPICIQKNYFFNIKPNVSGQEDCLYLNVYVPKINTKKLLPIMVFIHYGGYFSGNSRSDYIGPEYFMDEDIILVTFNYRLGIFGFLTTLDDNAPGNLALKDQVLALKWIKNNIYSFGGDCNSITIFGQSAGAGSVMLHLLSPASKGLFHRVISQSGTSLDLWARPYNAIQPQILQTQIQIVNCNKTKKNDEIIKCLQQIDAETLANSVDAFKYFSIEPLTPYTLVTEKQTALNPEPFLTRDPLELMKIGNFTKVPIIMGVVENEGILRSSPLLRQRQTRTELNQKFDDYLPKMLFLPFSTKDPPALWKSIKNFYLDGKNFIDIRNNNSIQNFIDLYSDRAFIYGVYQSIVALTSSNSIPVYVYRMSYKGSYSYEKLFAATNEEIEFDWGVCHCDDLLYLFTSKQLFPKLKSPSDKYLSKKLVQLWSSFAHFGVPDPSFNWTQAGQYGAIVNPETIPTLHITGSAKEGSVGFHSSTGFFSERMNFWRKQDLFENAINRS